MAAGAARALADRAWHLSQTGICRDGTERVPFDEAWAAPGSPAPHYQAMLEAIARSTWPVCRPPSAASCRRGGVTFGGRPCRRPDPAAARPTPEWDALEPGLAQRAPRAEPFVRDVYGDQEIVTAGVVERHVIEEAEGFEPDLAGRLPRHPWPAAIIGFDVVRDPTESFWSWRTT